VTIPLPERTLKSRDNTFLFVLCLVLYILWCGLNMLLWQALSTNANGKVYYSRQAEIKLRSIPTEFEFCTSLNKINLILPSHMIALEVD